MTNDNTAKKPFGLTVAVKVAQEAIKNSIAPSSVVISNLFYLQKSKVFPKDLDKQFFASAKYQADDFEKKIITKLLDNFKRPQVNVQELLESVLIDGWVKKIPLKPVAKPSPINFKSQKKVANTNAKKKESISPTIVVKKAKL